MSDQEVIPWGWENDKLYHRVLAAIDQLNSRYDNEFCLELQGRRPVYCNRAFLPCGGDKIIYYASRKFASREALSSATVRQHPFTPWIFFHRIGHRLQFIAKDSAFVNQHIVSAIDTIADLTMESIRFQRANGSWRRLPNKNIKIDYKTVQAEIALNLNPYTTDDDENLIKNAYYRYATCRTARDRTLNDTADIFAELFAQWAITGSVKLEHKHSEYYEDKLNLTFRKILNSLTGYELHGI